MKRVFIAVAILFAVVTSSFIFWAERNFDNPTSHVQTPVGYWRVSDIKKLFDGQQKNSTGSEIKVSLTAQIAGVDYLDNGVYSMYMSGLSSFSTLTKVGSGEEMFFSHQGDLFDKWDDIYVGGAKALLVAINADTLKPEVYPIVIYTPDFDSGQSELAVYLRALGPDESAEQLFNLYPTKLPVTNLKLFESFNLSSAVLLVEPFSTNAVQPEN